MCPDLTFEQVAHMLRANAILASEGTYRDVLNGEAAPNQQHSLIRKFRRGVPLALRRSTLLLGVLHVVGVSADKQVIRSDARRVVAAMQDQKSPGNQTIRQFPSNTVRKYWTAITRYAHVAVAVPVGGAGPQPAGIRLSHSTPESESDRFRVRTLPCAVAAKRVKPLVRPRTGSSQRELTSALLARANATIRLHRLSTSFGAVPSAAQTVRGLSLAHSTSAGVI